MSEYKLFFPHDAGARNNLKLMVMKQKEGAKGYGIYWMLIESLREQNGYKGLLNLLPTMARDFHVTTETLKRIIYDYALFHIADGGFSSPGLAKRMEPWDKQRETNKASGQRGGLVNQQRIRDKKGSPALAIQTNINKEILPSQSPQGGKGEKEEILLSPPEYALNPRTHNFNGLMEQLANLRITNIHEVNAILRLSNFGEKNTEIWKLLATTPWNKIIAPAKYILKVLAQRKS